MDYSPRISVVALIAAGLNPLRTVWAAWHSTFLACDLWRWGQKIRKYPLFQKKRAKMRELSAKMCSNRLRHSKPLSLAFLPSTDLLPPIYGYFQGCQIIITSTLYLQPRYETIWNAGNLKPWQETLLSKPLWSAVHWGMFYDKKLIYWLHSIVHSKTQLYPAYLKPYV